jgi:stage V sporulation protein SpoVS
MLCATPQRTATAQPAASRVIDRTLSCAVGAGPVTQLAAARTVQRGFVAVRGSAGKPLAYA